MYNEWDDEIEKLLTKRTTPHEKRVFQLAITNAKYGTFNIVNVT